MHLFSSEDQNVGVIGATSFVGEILVENLMKEKVKSLVFSRRSPSPLVANPMLQIRSWICVAPIWVLPLYFDAIEKSRGGRVIALSSTSRYTKQDSTDSAEKAIAEKLEAAERTLMIWAENKGIEWVILRPTLIYGRGRDKNISSISNAIRRFGFFPLLGRAQGLRQPIHAADVADVCLSALKSPFGMNKSYDISGGETLTYSEMVARVFIAMGRRKRTFTLPLWIFRFAVVCVRFLPRFRGVSTEMAVRMNRDLVFDHSEASKVFHFRPRGFALSAEDVSDVSP